MLKDLKAFVMRGNVLDLAVAAVIGAAFGAVINSLVNDIIMPVIGRLLGKVDSTNLYISLIAGPHPKTLAEAKAAGIATVNYGVFINFVIIFLIIAFVVSLIARQVAKMQRKPEAAPAAPTKKCPECLSTIPVLAENTHPFKDPLSRMNSPFGRLVPSG